MCLETANSSNETFKECPKSFVVPFGIKAISASCSEFFKPLKVSLRVPSPPHTISFFPFKLYSSIIFVAFLSGVVISKSTVQPLFLKLIKIFSISRL